MSKLIRKKHNVSALIYHIVCPAKYRRVVFSDEVDQELREICLEIAKRYEIEFVEIGVDQDHVHFLVQSVPSYSPTKIVRIIKSITAREIFKRVPQVKQKLWGVNFGRMVISFQPLVNMPAKKSFENMSSSKGKTKKNIRNFIPSNYVFFDTP